MTSSTRRRTSSLTIRVLLMTWETVVVDTPDFSATCFIVAIKYLSVLPLNYDSGSGATGKLQTKSAGNLKTCRLPANRIKADLPQGHMLSPSFGKNAVSLRSERS